VKAKCEEENCEKLMNSAMLVAEVEMRIQQAEQKLQNMNLRVHQRFGFFKRE